MHFFEGFFFLKGDKYVCVLYIKLIPNEFVTDRWGIRSAAVKNSVEFFTPRDKSDRNFHTCEESVPWEIRFNRAQGCRLNPNVSISRTSDTNFFHTSQSCIIELPGVFYIIYLPVWFTLQCILVFQGLPYVFFFFLSHFCPKHRLWVPVRTASNEYPQSITKTCLYNVDPLIPHFYNVKLGFTGVYIIFLISTQNIDCGYSLEPPRRGGSNEYPQSMFWADIWKKNIRNFYLKIFIFWL